MLGECSFPVSFSSTLYKRAWVVVDVPDCRVSSQPTGAGSQDLPDHADSPHLHACLFLFCFHSIFDSADQFCQDQADLQNIIFKENG